jgi:MFS family permease
MTNLALPYIAHDLGISAESSIWIVNASQISLMVSLLPVAALADIVGYRHVYRGGLALFCVASLGCVLAPSLSWLIAARVVQGLGGAAIMAIQPALVRSIYPAQHAGPRPRLQHDSRGDLAGGRPLDRRGAALDLVVADAVRRLYPARRHLLHPGRTLPAAHDACPPAVRHPVRRCCREPPSAC